MKSFLFVALLVTLSNFPLLANSPTHAPAGLLINLLTHPEKTVITDPTPCFGWIVPTTQPNDAQSAFQILVATKRELLSEGQADLWDSGKVDSAQSLHLPYRGSTLTANSVYWWTVRCWNRQAIPSAFAIPQQFRTGDFDRSSEKWPGASRWVEIPVGPDRTIWGFEDRHPLAYHEISPVKTTLREDGVTFVDFGRAAFSSLRLKLTWNPIPGEPQETVIEIAVGEKNDGDALNRQPGGGVIYRRYPLRLRAGSNSYNVEFPRFVPKYPHSQAMPLHMPEVVPFRYAEVLPGTLQVRLDEARQLALWSQFDDTAATFKSSSPELDAVYELCRYFLKVNTFNGDYASSERERMMYEADTYIQQMGHYAVDREFMIARYSVANMLFHGSWPTEWISHCLLMAWADYQHTGDASFLARYYETLKPKTMTALAREDGLISTRTGRQSKEFLSSIHAPQLKDIVDWPTHMGDDYEFLDYNTVVNAFSYRALVLMASIAAVLGKTDEASEYSTRAEMVRDAFHSAFFDPEKKLYVDGIGSTHVSFHANLFPLAFGLVPEEFRPRVIEYLKSRGMACGVYPANYVLETFFDNGEAEHAIGLMTSDGDRGWLNMIRMGSTVTTEAWDMKFKHNISWTHAWSASPAHIIPRKLMGIEPLEAGFGKVRIRPQLGPLRSASVRLPTIRGEIRVSATNIPGEPFAMEVSLPANVLATVHLPAAQGVVKVQLDGVWLEARRDGGNLVIEGLGAGEHRLRVAGLRETFVSQ